MIAAQECRIDILGPRSHREQHAPQSGDAPAGIHDSLADHDR
jgi:hypothetical protein